MFTGELMSFIYWGSDNTMTTPMNMIIPEIVALLGFASIIVWHKRLHLL
jgi:hypothetical protein